MDATAQEVLSFWLDEVGPEGWYDGAAFDEPIRARFGALWEEARAGRRDRWICAPASCLALVIVLDQFPRNMFRGDARSFASDRKARAVAKAAIQRGHDLRIEPPARQFFYMPLMHSEFLPDQEKSVRLFLLNAPRREPPARPGAPGGDPPLRPLPLPQRRARADEHAEGGGVPGGGRLSRGDGGSGDLSLARLARRAEFGYEPGQAGVRRGTAHGSQELRRRRHRGGAGRIRRRDPGGAAEAEDRLHRARAPGRHLPELGLHPDQGAAALVGDLPPDAPRQGLRAERERRRLRPRRGGQALARGGQAAGRGRRAPPEEEQGRRGDGRGQPAGEGQDRGQDRQGQRGDRGEGDHHRHRRPGARPAGAGGGRQAGLELQARALAAAHAQAAAGDRLGGDRHRVRELLQHPRRRDDGGGGARPHPAGRGRRDLGLRQEGVPEAEDAHPRRRDGQEARPRRRQGDRDHRGGGQDDERGLRHGDLGGRDRRQRRGARARGARGKGAAAPRDDRRVLPHRGRGPLRHRRRGRARRGSRTRRATRG